MHKKLCASLPIIPLRRFCVRCPFLVSRWKHCRHIRRVQTWIIFAVSHKMSSCCSRREIISGRLIFPLAQFHEYVVCIWQGALRSTKLLCLLYGVHQTLFWHYGVRKFGKEVRARGEKYFRAYCSPDRRIRTLPSRKPFWAAFRAVHSLRWRRHPYFVFFLKTIVFRGIFERRRSVFLFLSLSRDSATRP